MKYIITILVDSSYYLKENNQDTDNSTSELCEKSFGLKKSSQSQFKFFYENLSQNIISPNINNLKKPSILKFISIIGQHKEPTNYIKELSNGILVSGGDNYIFFYKFFYNHLTYEKIKEYKIKNINIYEKNNKNNDIELLVCSNDISYILTITQNNKLNLDHNKKETKMRAYIKNRNNCLICNEKGVFQLINAFIRNEETKDYNIID